MDDNHRKSTWRKLAVGKEDGEEKGKVEWKEKKRYGSYSPLSDPQDELHSHPVSKSWSPLL